MSLGETFLQRSSATEFTISGHALDRIGERAGFRPTKALAHVWFERSRQLSYDEMVALGYRPNYCGRLKKGQPSWYFRFFVFNEEMIAVVNPAGKPGEYVWVTTYGRDVETDLFSWNRQPAWAAA